MSVVAVDLRQINVILLDIEGTTTPFTFVHRTLFAYARENLDSFLERNARRTDVLEDLARLRTEHSADRQRGGVPDWREGPGKLSGSPRPPMYAG